jgi:hypothetical protein
MPVNRRLGRKVAHNSRYCGRSKGAAVSLATRIARLEEGRGAFFVVHGHSKAEHKERIAELIAANEATPQSLFICIMQFGSRE